MNINEVLESDKLEAFILNNWSDFNQYIRTGEYSWAYAVSPLHIDFVYSGWKKISQVKILVEIVDPYGSKNGKETIQLGINEVMNWVGTIKLRRFSKGLDPTGVD